MVQLSYPYMTTGKTIALTRQTFVGKAMSLLFKMLSRLVIAFLSRNKCVLISWLQSPSAVNMLRYTTEMILGHPLGSFFWEKGIKKGQLCVCVCVCVEKPNSAWHIMACKIQGTPYTGEESGWNLLLGSYIHPAVLSFAHVASQNKSQIISL